MASTPPAAPAPAEPTGEVTTEGGVARFTPAPDAATQSPTLEEQAAANPPAEATPQVVPEGVTAEQWAEFQQWQADRAAPPAEPAAPTPPAEITLTPEQEVEVNTALAGVSPAMAEKAAPFVKLAVANGTLTDAEVTQAAEATGFSEAMVRQYMRGGDPEFNAAAAAAEQAPFLALTGGADQWASFQEWAGTALGPDDQKAINAALEASKPADVEKYVGMWKAAGNGPSPVDLSNKAAGGGAPKGDTTDVFTSITEQAKAQADPRYKTDQSYRDGVIAKIARSPNF